MNQEKTSQANQTPNESNRVPDIGDPNGTSNPGSISRSDLCTIFDDVISVREYLVSIENDNKTAAHECTIRVIEKIVRMLTKGGVQ